jgi:iron complex outermembrane receptor protein
MILGGYYGRDAIKTNNRVDFFNAFSDVRAALGYPATWFNPLGGLVPGSAVITGLKGTQDFRQIRTSLAVYGEGSYEITPRLKLTAGLRYTTDKTVFKDAITAYYDDAGNRRSLVVSDYADTGTGIYYLQPVFDANGNVVIPASAGPIPGGLRREGKTSRLTGRAIIDWKPIDNVMLYASYSRGYRAGTFNGLGFIDYTQIYFVRPEEVSSYEVGFKSRLLDNRLQINGSVFYYDYTGQQTQAVDTNGTANLIALDGTLKGLELDVQFAATDRLTLNASVGLLDTKFAKYDNATCEATDLTGLFPVQKGSCILSGAGKVSLGGNPFPYAAKSSINLGFDWDALDFGSGKLKVHGDASYLGHFYFDSFKDYSRGVLTRLATGKYTLGEGDYWLANSRISYVTDRFTLSAWGKNLTNKFYYTAGYPNEAHTAQGYRVRGLPRTYGVEATFKF